MPQQATGLFDVTLNPRTPDSEAEETVSRMTIDKQFHGDLDARSKGQMLAFSTEVDGSAAYVALERVNGSLHGKSGSFALQHQGIMARGEPNLSVTVVPDSGTEQLLGLSGRMSIDIVDGQHRYDFEYTLRDEAQAAAE